MFGEFPCNGRCELVISVSLCCLPAGHYRGLFCRCFVGGVSFVSFGLFLSFYLFFISIFYFFLSFFSVFYILYYSFFSLRLSSPILFSPSLLCPLFSPILSFTSLYSSLHLILVPLCIYIHVFACAYASARTCMCN